MSFLIETSMALVSIFLAKADASGDAALPQTN
jgi:hypothetical protein